MYFHKPDSVHWYLTINRKVVSALSFIWHLFHNKYLAVYPLGIITIPIKSGCYEDGRAGLNPNIRDIATHEVYPLLMLPSIGVSSYLTVSPLSAIRRTV